MNKSLLFFSAFTSRKQMRLSNPRMEVRIWSEVHIFQHRLMSRAGSSCWSAGTAVLQRPCSREERLTHDGFSPVAPHVATNLLGFLFSIPASLEKGSLGNPCDPTQAAVYYCWFLSRALEAVNTRQNGPWEENTNDKMYLFDPKISEFQPEKLGAMVQSVKTSLISGVGGWVGECGYLRGRSSSASVNLSSLLCMNTNIPVSFSGKRCPSEDWVGNV